MSELVLLVWSRRRGALAQQFKFNLQHIELFTFTFAFTHTHTHQKRKKRWADADVDAAAAAAALLLCAFCLDSGTATASATDFRRDTLSLSVPFRPCASSLLSCVSSFVCCALLIHVARSHTHSLPHTQTYTHTRTQLMQMQ